MKSKLMLEKNSIATVVTNDLDVRLHLMDCLLHRIGQQITPKVVREITDEIIKNIQEQGNNNG